MKRASNEDSLSMEDVPTIDFGRYAGRATRESTPDEQKVQEDPISVKESLSCMFGVIPVHALRTMAKRHFSIVADATLDDIAETFRHVLYNVQGCDTCDEAATREADIRVTDKLDAPIEHACDGCKFSRGVKNIRPTSAAAAIHRVKALLAKLQDRR